jgi:periplasmic protein TonB
VYAVVLFSLEDWWTKMADLSQPNNPLPPNADDHLSRLFLEEIEEPWYRSFVRNVKEYFDPPKLPPLEVTSRPVAVKDIWGLYGRQKKSFMMSTGFQIAVVTVLFTLGATRQGQQVINKVVPIFAPSVDLAPPEALPKKQLMQGGGGGGDRSPLPASRGKLPRASLRQFTPPVAVYNNLNPKLMMEPTIIAPPDTPLPQVNSPNYGDPFGKSGILSNGTGSGGGIGSGKGGGVGSGKGPGVGPGEGGGFGGGVFRAGGGVSKPQVLKQVEPEYSEEARKAKYQGTVVLSIEVDPNGHAQNIQVRHSLGLGLDEKAIDAVKKWIFIPGKKDGKPVTVAATIEVNFRLL